MLVCHCNRICDRIIRETIRIGARTVADVGRRCGAGTDCGGCRPVIRELLSNAALEDQAGCEMGADDGDSGAAISNAG